VNLSSIGLSGIMQSEALAARSASKLVQSAVGSAGGTDPAQDIVSLQQASSGVAIGAKVVATSQELSKSLLDIFA
jgi:hypothetical protein